MPSPVRLADFLTAAYGLGGVRSVLALDALFLLMQAHDLDYPDFYDSLYRLVTPDMMYAKYRARFFRMVDLCLTSSHVPAYVVAAFLKRFARATLQAPPSGALFTLALVRKLIGRHPECLPLISSRAPAVSDSKHRLLTSSGALSGTTGLKNRPLTSSDDGAPGGAASPPPGGAADGGAADEYDPGCENTKGAGAMKTSLWELAALQNHYHPGVATLARGFLREADKKEAEGEAFAGPSKLAAETYQSLFDQEMRRKMGTDVPLAFRRPKGLFDDVPEEGGGVFAAVNFSIS
ncbi:unnamed protein product [Ectocarpus sp. 8 AP-2014]